jgi:hypothetical protein
MVNIEFEVDVVLKAASATRVLIDFSLYATLSCFPDFLLLRSGNRRPRTAYHSRF